MSKHVSRSRLLRLLGEATALEMEPSRQDFAERLSLWLSAVDAVTLHATLQAVQSAAVARAAAAHSASTPTLTVADACQRVRQALVDAIMAPPAPSARGDHVRPPFQAEAAPDTAAGYAGHHKRYLELQRLMESKIAPLRTQVRQALSSASPRLRQLATLDAVMEQTLGGREQKLLSTVPVFLERRFEQLRQSHQEDTFSKEVQEILLAELDVRLQPIVGLMEAFSNEVKKYP